MSPFRLGLYLPELRLPFEQALGVARAIGIDYVWFVSVDDGPAIARMSDAHVDRMAEAVARHGLRLFIIQCGTPFKQIHLMDLDPGDPLDHRECRQHFDDVVRSMHIAARLGVRTVGTFTFAWPGEYTAAKPTWPMRWATRGGVISEREMTTLVRVFSLILEQAERLDVDVALSMMPWNYTNTTGHFRALAERLGSRRLRVIWGPADNLHGGEADVATAGFLNVRPYLHALHLKDIHIVDGPRNVFEYRPLGEGDVDYRAILRQLHAYQGDVVLSLATHFLPPSGSAEEAVRINHANLLRLIARSTPSTPLSPS